MNVLCMNDVLTLNVFHKMSHDNIAPIFFNNLKIFQELTKV